MTAIATVAGITMRQLLSRRRFILLLLLAGVIVLLAGAYRLTGEASDEASALGWTVGVLEFLGLGALVPLVALILGTAAFGNELEDGTAVHLLTKPVPRWQIGLAKLAVAAGLAALLSSGAILASGLISAPEPGVAIGFAVGAAVGSVLYVTIFMALSLMMSRAFIIGLAYVLIWEGLLAGLFEGIATLSVRQYATSIALTLTEALSEVVDDLDARLAPETAIIAALVVGVTALVLGLRRLARLEVASESV